MYLEHFKLNHLPFSLTPNTHFYCDVSTHQEALNVLLLSLKMGEGFVKIIGEVGVGKTLLCRLLLNELEKDYVTAYIPTPDQNGYGLRLSLAHELGLSVDASLSPHLVLDKITHRLLENHKQGKHTVLIIDEAQVLSNDGLEAIRLLTNLETEQKKLLQVVLFGQPELDNRLAQHSMRQLKQRITFSYYLQPLKKCEMDLYLSHRLAKSGHTYGMLFSKRAKKMLFRASRGLPRIMNIVCHKALLVSFGRGIPHVDARSMRRAIIDLKGTVVREYRLGFATLASIFIGCYVLFICLTFWRMGLFS